MQRIVNLSVLLLIMSLACSLIPTPARTFENEFFAFTIPAGWQTREEIWGQAAASGQEYKGLGVNEMVAIQYPPEKGNGKAYFVAASSPLVEGQDLETRFKQAYQTANPGIKDASQKAFQLGEWSGFEITYKRPWGEPWWQFRDIWLEKDGVIYVLAFYATPNSFDNYTESFDQILASFRFKD